MRMHDCLGEPREANPVGQWTQDLEIAPLKLRAYDHLVTADLATLQTAAQQLFQDQKHEDALGAFTVVRKLRARREGTESAMYLSNLHSQIYCLHRLERFTEALSLVEELSTTRDRVLGLNDSASIDAKRWWVWTSRKVGDFSKASDLEIEIADVLYSAGDNEGAERAVATAVFYQNQSSNSRPEDVVAVRMSNVRNGENLKEIIKKVGGGALAGGVTAAFEGVVGGLFD